MTDKLEQLLIDKREQVSNLDVELVEAKAKYHALAERAFNNPANGIGRIDWLTEKFGADRAGKDLANSPRFFCAGGIGLKDRQAAIELGKLVPEYDRLDRSHKQADLELKQLNSEIERMEPLVYAEQPKMKSEPDIQAGLQEHPAARKALDTHQQYHLEKDVYEAPIHERFALFEKMNNALDSLTVEELHAAHEQIGDTSFQELMDAKQQRMTSLQKQRGYTRSIDIG